MRLLLGVGLTFLIAAPESMPLHEVPATTGRTLAVFLSGDGGWASIDKDVSKALADSGVAVVGIDALSYLGTRRTPEEVSADVATVLRTYLDRWHRERVILVGYSRGADIMPFVARRIPEDLRARVDLVAMLGLGIRAGFHVTVFSMIHSSTSAKDPEVTPELEALAALKVPMLCVYGLEEKESLCREYQGAGMARVAREGAHHFDGDRVGLAGEILRARRRGE
jgi:type IV secretory pathway VirJ component